MVYKIKKIISKFMKRDHEECEKEYRLSRGMKIGDNCNIYSWSTIDGGHPKLISIGDNVTISTNVTILTHDASTNIVGCGTKLGRVSIGNNVFIGTRVVILCNVHIGNNVIVGAGSVVTQDLADNGVYAGVPAKRVCSIETYKEKYQSLRETRPRFDLVRPWYDWKNATEQETEDMAKALEDGIGFI